MYSLKYLALIAAFAHQQVSAIRLYEEGLEDAEVDASGESAPVEGAPVEESGEQAPVEDEEPDVDSADQDVNEADE